MPQGQESSLATEALTPTVAAKMDHFPRFTPVASITASEYNSVIAGHLSYCSFNYVSVRCYWPEAQVARMGDGLALILSDIASGSCRADREWGNPSSWT
jgi:hypothetical protein